MGMLEPQIIIVELLGANTFWNAVVVVGTVSLSHVRSLFLVNVNLAFFHTYPHFPGELRLLSRVALTDSEIELLDWTSLLSIHNIILLVNCCDVMEIGKRKCGKCIE